MRDIHRKTSSFLHVALTVFVGSFQWACETAPTDAEREAAIAPTRLTVPTTQPEEDAVVVDFQEPLADSGSSAASSRTRAQTPGAEPLVPAEPNSSAANPPTGDRPETAADESAKASPAATVESPEPPRRTSMPSRDGKGSKPRPTGGVRKAVPVDLAASALFGKWKVERTSSTEGWVRADAILFLGDGRMRIWREGGVEDGRWTWTKGEGIKTGGIDGVPLILGSFDSVEGTLVVTGVDDKHISLKPDRIFVVPAPVTPAAAPVAKPTP